MGFGGGDGVLSHESAQDTNIYDFHFRFHTTRPPIDGRASKSLVDTAGAQYNLDDGATS